MRFPTFLWKNICRRKVRSLLTSFGVAVAVGTTVALLGISDGFERSSVQSFEARGVDIVVVDGKVLDQLNSDLPEELGERIERIPGVVHAAPGLLELIEYSKSSSVIGVLVQGWRPESFLFDDLKLIDGRRIVRGDRHVVMLGKTLAENIKKQIGDTFEIEREDFEVIGIYESLSFHENAALVVPLDVLQEVMARDGSVTGFSVVVDRSIGGEDPVLQVGGEIAALTDERGRALELSAMPTREYVSNSLHIQMAHAMAWLTSAIAIVVGSIGMLNTMIMSVVERIKEISILRAIGWRKSRVVRMILGESIFLSVAGAVVGTLAAVVLIRWLTTLPIASGIVEGTIALDVIVKGFAMALFVGVVGGTYPAWRASRLLPSEGLRHE